MTKKRIPRLQTDRAASVYWDTHSFAKAAEDTTEATIRFVKKPKPTLKRKSARPDQLHASTTGSASSHSK